MAVRVAAPDRQARSGGIKTVTGEFTLENRLSVSDGDVVWEDPGCGGIRATRAGCQDDIVEAADKTADGYLELGIISPPFARYAGKQCYLGGDDEQSYRDQAADLLEAWEDREVEGVLWDWAADAATPGTAADVKAAIAEAEEYADANYVGQPVLLMSRRLASLAGDVVEKDEASGRLGTKLGTPVIATGAAPADEQSLVMIIGRPRVYASNVVSATAIDHRNNVEMAIAERVYALGVDCDFRHRINVGTPPDETP